MARKLMTTKTKIFLIGIVYLALTFGCSNEQTHYHPGGPYYYSSFGNYHYPFRPVDEITEEVALENHKNGQSYYIAYFYDNGLIKSFEKHFRGKQLFKDTYFYQNGKLTKSEKIDEAGEITIYHYDEEGNRKP